MKKQLNSSPACCARLHRVRGVFSFTLATWVSACSCSANLNLPVSGVGAFMNTPESTTLQRAIGSFSISFTQADHRKVAVAPADAPVKSTLEAEEKLKLFCSHLKCDLTLSAPLKYRDASLKRQALSVDPWWRAPSQQTISTFVQDANLLREGSVEQYPSPSMVQGRSLLLPSIDLLRWQQLSNTSERVVPSQQPPPWKQMRNLSFSSPWCRQTAGDDPSRHLALGSVL